MQTLFPDILAVSAPLIRGFPILSALPVVTAAMLNTYRSTHSTSDYSILRAYATNIINWFFQPKKLTTLSLVKSSEDNPRQQWNTINRILHRISATLLPSSVSLSALANQFAAFFKDKISQLRLKLLPNATQSTHCPSPAPPPDFSTFPPATVEEISKLFMIVLTNSVILMLSPCHYLSTAPLSWRLLSHVS